MNPLLGIQEGFREINSHRFRSFLTGIGVVLGVASLMSMLALTNGQTVQFRKNLERWGGVERLEVEPRPVPEEQEHLQDMSPGITYRDAIALRRVPLVELVSPELRLTKGGVLEYGANRHGSRWFRGVEEPFLKVERHEIAAGRFFTDVDQRNRARVIVLGQNVKENLFGEVPTEDAVGKSVLFNGVSFRVVGVFKDYENWFKNHVTVIPFTTMQELFFSSDVNAKGVDQGPIDTVNRMVVRVRDVERIDEAIEQMRNVLLRTHHGVEDFGFDTRLNWFENIEASVSGVRLSGFIISGVTLIAAGVGITNIMMASIKERTREIGVRRALGANQMDIFLQICMEALVLALIGGILGVVSGFGLVELLKELLDGLSPLLIDPGGILFSFLAAVSIGFLAGIAPALQASRLEPIQALRFE